MEGFPIRDVCKLLGVKPYVLRYWEQEIPLLAPKKDLNGRRKYTWADLEILFRLRYLLHEKGYTVAGARKRIWEEFTGDSQNQKAMLMSIRGELIKLLQKSHAVRSGYSEIDNEK
ncbi:MAG: MerR family transcriptional regulator [Spirochaetales bacterium]|jgi:DNA-binding transcriptional MerR regulator|nr:MerR family transcriptional regulator [Spirochaetales bacterium]